MSVCNVGLLFFLFSTATDATKKKCTDINECLSSHKCDMEVSTCVNNVGSYTCVCKDGYEKINGICVDIDECEKNIDKCNVNAKCINTPGSYRCECNSGFNGDGYRCDSKNNISFS